MAAQLAEAKTALEGANAARVVEVAAAEARPMPPARARSAGADQGYAAANRGQPGAARRRAGARAPRQRACPTSTKRTSRTRNSSPTRSASFVKRRTASRRCA